MAERSPVERAREEGASPSLVRWVERVDDHLPRAGPQTGFWVAVYGRFARHRGSVLAGGLAFFAMLSLIPALLSLGAVVALLVDPADFVAQVRTLFADQPDLIAGFEPLLDQIASLSRVNLTSVGMAGLISLAVSLYAASRFIYVGRQVLDITFELDPQPPNLLSRGVAILATLVVQVAIVLGLVALTLVPRVLDALGVGEIYSANVRLFRLPVAALIVYLLLTVSMRFGTQAFRVVHWANLGALMGTLVVVLGTLGLSWYLTVSTTYSQVVAVLGGVIALEIWMYVIGLAIVGSAEVEGVRHGLRRRDLNPQALGEGGQG